MSVATIDALVTMQFQVINTHDDDAIADGVRWDDEEQEWAIWLNGDIIAWAGSHHVAMEAYLGALHYDCEHRRRCPEDYEDIPYDGGPVEGYEPVDHMDDLGLEATA